ncbi:hypothetical protein GCM10023331_35880 [Algivirga pacifica]|uniref:Uncharacterized protein n=2 Tax=Algivirga pacifica TaxID=1162670 RepID=A0ABP9DIU8_9BACT
MSQKEKELEELRKQQSQTMRNIEQPVDITAAELREYMHTFLVDFVDYVEVAADSIIHDSNDKEIKKNALLWKMYAIPAAKKAILVNDPLIGLFDGAALCLQMKNFFATGAGSGAFGEYQPLPIAVSDTLLDRSMEIYMTLSKNRYPTIAVESIKDFAAQHPIESIYFNRKSTAPLLAEYFDKEKLGLKGLVVGASESVTQFAERIDIYVDLLPKQARWQASYMVQETLEDIRKDSAAIAFSKKVDRVEGSIVGVSNTIERFPYTLDQQREAFMYELQNESRTLMNALGEENDKVLNKATEERKALILDADALAEKYSNQLMNRIEDLIFKLFWIGSLILFLGILLLSAIAFFFMKHFKNHE